MEQGKTNMIGKLKSILLSQGQCLAPDFEQQASQMSMSDLAIKISLAQAGI